MVELLKLIWDAVVLRDAARKGQVKWKMWPIAFGFVFLLYAIGVPSAALYEKGPQYRPLFVLAMVLDGLVLVAMIMWAIRYRRNLMATKSSADAEIAHGDGSIRDATGGR